MGAGSAHNANMQTVTYLNELITMFKDILAEKKEVNSFHIYCGLLLGMNFARLEYHYNNLQQLQIVKLAKSQLVQLNSRKADLADVIVEFIKNQALNTELVLMNKLMEYEASHRFFGYDCSIKKKVTTLVESISKGMTPLDRFLDAFVVGLEWERKYTYLTQLGMNIMNHMDPILESLNKFHQLSQQRKLDKKMCLQIVEKFILQPNDNLQELINSIIHQPVIVEEVHTCHICLETCTSKNKYLKLQACNHVFHINQCLNQYCMTKIKAIQFPIICPEQNCKQEIRIDDLAKILNKKELLLFYEQSLKLHIDTNQQDLSWCITPDCKYAYMNNGNFNDCAFKCPLCRKSYCLNCKEPDHNGKNCYEKKFKQEDKAFKQYASTQDWKKCPNCKILVERIKGCNHMTCKCNFEFCYQCGGVYLKCECVSKAKRQEFYERFFTL